MVKLTNYCYGALGVEIQFLYNKHGQVGRRMKDLDQIMHISKAFFILDTLSWSNQADNFIGLSGSWISNAIITTFLLKAFFRGKTEFFILKVTALLRYCITVKKKHLTISLMWQILCSDSDVRHSVRYTK